MDIQPLDKIRQTILGEMKKKGFSRENMHDYLYPDKTNTVGQNKRDKLIRVLDDLELHKIQIVCKTLNIDPMSLIFGPSDVIQASHTLKNFFSLSPKNQNKVFKTIREHVEPEI